MGLFRIQYKTLTDEEKWQKVMEVVALFRAHRPSGYCYRARVYDEIAYIAQMHGADVAIEILLKSIEIVEGERAKK